MQKNERPTIADRAPEANHDPSTAATDFADLTRSRSVAWWPVHEYVTRLTDRVDSWPMAGTPAWCELTDEDPRKLAAVLDAGQHHALRVEVAQEAAAEASKTISAAVDWRAMAQDISRRRAFYAARPWLKRVVA